MIGARDSIASLPTSRVVMITIVGRCCCPLPGAPLCLRRDEILICLAARRCSYEAALVSQPLFLFLVLLLLLLLLLFLLLFLVQIRSNQIGSDRIESNRIRSRQRRTDDGRAPDCARGRDNLINSIFEFQVLARDMYI